MDLAPLPPELLPEGVRRIVGPEAPPPLKMMAARGMAPLPPAEIGLVLYQLAVGPDEALRGAARKTASELPERVLQALLPAALPAPVLHLFAQVGAGRPEVLEPILLNKGVADETVVLVARNADEAICELVATNEQRVLRAPAILEALYGNRRARQSTVDRLIELCVRNGIRCDGIPSFDEAAEAVEAQGPPVFDGEEFEVDVEYRAGRQAGDEALAALKAGLSADAKLPDGAPTEAGSDEDEALKAALAAEEEGIDESQKKRSKRIDELPMSAKIRLATVGNAFHRSVLVRDPKKQVAMAVIRSPALTELEVERIAANRAVRDDVLRTIAMNGPWMRNYRIKLNLAFNPKTPIAVSLKLMPHLFGSDIKALTRSRSVPGALSSAAKRLLAAREKK